MFEEFAWEKEGPVEFFVSGILVLLALAICVATLSPRDIETILNYLDQYQSLPVGVLLSTIFIAIAYAVGVLSEFIGRITFEPLLDVIKRKYFRGYIKRLEESEVDLTRSPILEKIKGVRSGEITKEEARSCIGPMRFYVLMKSPELYRDIGSQMNRFRLLRVMFIVEMILIITVLLQLFREFSSPLSYALIVLGMIICVNIMAIKDRFHRYCRAIERSYSALVFDQDQDTGMAKIAPQPEFKMKMKVKKVNTEIAHQSYSCPLVGVIVFLLQGDEVAVFEQPDGTWKLPEKYARGDEDIEQAVHCTLFYYLQDSQKIRIESYTLLSGEGYRDDIYQYNYVAFVKMNDLKAKSGNQITLVSKTNIGNVDIYPPHKKLLEEYLEKGLLEDKVTVPCNPAKRLESDENRLKETKRIHAEYTKIFPMPLIPVDGLLLKFSGTREFEGIILERRSRKVDREPGKWAFPAGFVRAHETVSEALAYEVYEEIGIILDEDHFLSIYRFGTDPYRDPRYFVWTQFLVVYTKENPMVRSDEIEEARVFPPSKIPWDEMAFDHGDVLEDFIELIPYYVERVLEMWRN